MQRKRLQTPFFTHFNFKKIFLVVFLIGAFFSILLIVDSFFRIRNIHVENLPTSLTIQGLSNYQNARSILLNPVSVGNFLKKNNPLIKDISVKITYPNTLSLFIVIDRPIAYLQVEGGYFALSSTGKILKKDRQGNETLPFIHYYQKFDYESGSVGTQIDFKDLITALTILHKTEGSRMRFDSIDINGSDMLVCNLKDKKIIFTTERDIDQEIYEFGAIVRQFKIQGKDFKSLDLRFDKPLVVF